MIVSSPYRWDAFKRCAFRLLRKKGISVEVRETIYSETWSLYFNNHYLSHMVCPRASLEDNREFAKNSYNYLLNISKTHTSNLSRRTHEPRSKARNQIHEKEIV